MAGWLPLPLRDLKSVITLPASLPAQLLHSSSFIPACMVVSQLNVLRFGWNRSLLAFAAGSPRVLQGFKK